MQLVEKEVINAWIIEPAVILQLTGNFVYSMHEKATRTIPAAARR